MEIFTESFLSLFFQLVPGFIASWVFYGLTPIEKPDQLDRVVNALIYSVLIKIFIFILSSLLWFIGDKWISFGLWTENVELIYSVVIAFSFGILLSHATNHDTVHRFLRFLRITLADSYPSQWYEEMINNDESLILLSLLDGRRIYGYAIEKAESPKNGHFVLSPYIWLTGVLLDSKIENEDEDKDIQHSNGDPADFSTWNTSKILIASKLVEFVEFVKLVPYKENNNANNSTEANT